MDLRRKAIVSGGQSGSIRSARIQNGLRASVHLNVDDYGTNSTDSSSGDSNIHQISTQLHFYESRSSATSYNSIYLY